MLQLNGQMKQFQSQIELLHRKNQDKNKVIETMSTKFNAIKKQRDHDIDVLMKKILDMEAAEANNQSLPEPSQLVPRRRANGPVSDRDRSYQRIKHAQNNPDSEEDVIMIVRLEDLEE